jgi:hypothetical protein
MAAPNVTAVILTIGIAQGAAIYKARQQNTWPAPRTELALVVVGLMLMLATRAYPPAKWLGVIVVLGALAQTPASGETVTQNPNPTPTPTSQLQTPTPH